LSSLTATPTPDTYTLSLHDALPIYLQEYLLEKGPKLLGQPGNGAPAHAEAESPMVGGVIHDNVLWACTTCRWCVDACPVFIEHRSEEHTSELQSLTNLVCRLLLEKK